MKISRESRKLARELFRHSFVEGRLEASRVSAIADRLVTEKPRGYFEALKEFTRLTRIELARRHAIARSAVALDPEASTAIQNSLRARFGDDVTVEFRVEPSLIGGLRVQVGSDVWDGSVRARLDALKN